MTLEEAQEIQQRMIFKKVQYANLLLYRKQQLEESGMDTSLITEELKEVREETAAMEIVNGRLQVYKNVAQQEGARR